MEHTIGIVGCGLIGQKRAKALGRGKLVACADIQRERAEQLARPHAAAATTDWREVTRNPAVSLVIVATTNQLLAEVTAHALEAGKHVLVEKPAATSAAERILAMGGASLPKRDAIDRQTVDSVRNRTGKFIVSQKEVGGWPELASAPAPADSDQDGMPDAWEKAHGLDPNDASDGSIDRDGNGYTQLEDYLNGLVTF